MKKKVVAIGEVLWDVFPDKKIPGGSSMNVSLHLHKQGIDSELISAVGDDELGNELIDFLKSVDFPTRLIQQNHLPTSTVQVKLDDNLQASYTIVDPVAWDEIELAQLALTAVKNADAFVFCSLTCRNEKSRSTIYALLNEAKFRVFDINLRQPFYTAEIIKHLLKHTDLLKINEDEILYLKEIFQLTASTDEELFQHLTINYHIQLICLTMGAKGALVWHLGETYNHPGYQTQVVDTVGAGDSFLATFMASHLRGNSIADTLALACLVGAFVAGKPGANPTYDSEILNLLK